MIVNNVTRIRKAFSPFIIIFLFLLPLPGFSGDENPDSYALPQLTYRFEQIVKADGFGGERVFNLIQDRQGLIWLATQSGLIRYDSHDFKAYKHDPDNPHSIGDNTLLCLYEDQNGHIWIGFRSEGVDRFDPETEQFTHFRHDPNNGESLTDNRINSINGDSGGRIWICTNRGLNQYSQEKQTFIRYQHNPDNPHSIAHSYVDCIMEDQTSQIWVGSHGGLQKLDPENRTFSGTYAYDLAQAPDNFSHHSITSLCEDSQGILWAGTLNGLLRFDPKTEHFKRYAHDPDDPTSLSGNTIKEVIEVSPGELWVSTSREGLNVFNPETEKSIRYRHHPHNPTGLLSNSVKLYKDKTGIIWMTAGVSDGLVKFDPLSTRFPHYRSDSDIPNSLRSGINTLYETAGGELWLGGYGDDRGLIRFDRKNNRFKCYMHDPGNPQGLGGKYVSAIDSKDDRFLWVGTFDGGINVLDIQKEQFLHDRSDISQLNKPRSNGLTNSYISALRIDHTGKVWIGRGHAGLDRYDPLTRTVTNYPLKFDDPTGLGASSSNIMEDSKRRLWLGTSGAGLHRYNPTTDNFTRYQHDPEDPNSLSHNEVWMVYEDDKGILWIATSGGLNKFNPETETFIRYLEKDGLSNGNISSIIGGDHGNLWLGTNAGLNQFDPNTGIFRVYDTEDIPGNGRYNQGVLKSRSGEILFATSGLLVFDPKKVVDNPYIPPVLITDFQLFKQSVPVMIGEDVSLQAETPALPRAIHLMNDITLRYDQNVFSFTFAALNYHSSIKNQYAYKMDGFDKDWTYTDSENRMASYTNLNSGKYVFRVIASNNDGLWNKEGTSIQVIIIPPWWETAWFRVIVALLLGSMAVILVLWRTRRLEVQKQKLELLVTERTQELEIAKETAEKAKEKAQIANRAKSTFVANMSHELRTPLNAILGFSNLMRREALRDPTALNPTQQDNLGLIYRGGEHLLTLINSILNLSKIEAGQSTLIISNFDLYQLLDDLVDMISIKAEEKKLRILLERTPEVPQYIRTDMQKLRQVFLNLLSNALKFTDQGGVSIRARRVEQPPHGNKPASQAYTDSSCQLYFEVEDSGRGIAPEEFDSVFKAFAQTETGRQSTEGTGLGMSISREFVSLMGGTLDVRSEVNKGTSFFFTINVKTVSEADLEKDIPDRQIIGLKPGQPGYRILVVDDSESNRRLLIALLQPLGFDIKEATNGQEAVDLHEAWKPHFIWMDMRMPVMNGQEATRIIKSSKDGKETKIVALTASSFEEDRVDIMKSGCDDFLRKPFRENSIFEIMHQHIGVEFIFKESKKIPDTVPIYTQLSQEKLIAIPSEILIPLKEAAIRAHFKEVEHHIESVRIHDETIAKALADLASKFQFQKIVTIIHDASLET